jgi:hypothetical protein
MIHAEGLPVSAGSLCGKKVDTAMEFARTASGTFAGADNSYKIHF